MKYGLAVSQVKKSKSTLMRILHSMYRVECIFLAISLLKFTRDSI